MNKIITEEEKKRLIEMVRQGKTVAEVCKSASVSRSALYHWMSLYSPRKRWASQGNINLKDISISSTACSQSERNFLCMHSPLNDLCHLSRTFKKAYEERKPTSGLLFHSDLGVQYTSFEFRELLRTCNVRQSYSNPGCPYDNAVSEGFFSIMKREELSHNWYQSLEELQNTVDEYIGFFN